MRTPFLLSLFTLFQPGARTHVVKPHPPSLGGGVPDDWQGGLKANHQAGTERDRSAALLFFGAGLATDAETLAAAYGAQFPYPTAGPAFRCQSEFLSAGEMCGGAAERASDDLPPSAFRFDPQPTVVRVAAPEIKSGSQGARHCELVAGA